MKELIGKLIRNGMLAIGTAVIGWSGGKISADDWATLIEPAVGLALAAVSVLWKWWINRQRAKA